MTPLLDLFFDLRRRNLPLGVSEYVAGLEALAAGFGVGSRADLCGMCQALWSKSPEENEQVAESLDQILPTITQAELDALAGEAKKELEDRFNAAPTGPGVQDSRPDETETDGEPEVSCGVELMSVPTAAADTPLLPRAASESRRRIGTRFDLVGDLPVPSRYVKRAWRYVRSMQRVGPAIELDVEATAIRLCREGVLIAPVLAPRRRNLASVLLLVDEGGSMLPFRQTTAAVVDAARHSGFSRADVYYFHDVVGASLHRDPELRLAVPLGEAVRPYAGSGVMIVSDAGAARRRRDEDRTEKTRLFLAALRSWTPRIAWLNPVPRERWPGTTAEMVRIDASVQMFPFERGGLDAAMDVLRGRGN